MTFRSRIPERYIGNPAEIVFLDNIGDDQTGTGLGESGDCPGQPSMNEIPPAGRKSKAGKR